LYFEICCCLFRLCCSLRLKFSVMDGRSFKLGPTSVFLLLFLLLCISCQNPGWRRFGFRTALAGNFIIFTMVTSTQACTRLLRLKTLAVTLLALRLFAVTRNNGGFFCLLVQILLSLRIAFKILTIYTSAISAADPSAFNAFTV
jgi:hypothetical protein